MIAPNQGPTGIHKDSVTLKPEKDYLAMLTGPKTPSLAANPWLQTPAARMQTWLAKTPVAPELVPPAWAPPPKLLGPVLLPPPTTEMIRAREKADFETIAGTRGTYTLSGRPFDANVAVTNLHQATEGTVIDDHKMVRQTYFDLDPQQLKAVELVYQQRYPDGDFNQVLGVMPEVDRKAIFKLKSGNREGALADMLLDSTLGNKSGDKTKEVLDYIQPQEVAKVNQLYNKDSKGVTLDKAAAELMWDQEDKRVVAAKALGDKAKQGVAEMRQALWANKSEEVIDRLRSLKPEERADFEARFNLEVEAAKKTQAFNGSQLKDWVVTGSGMNPLKAMEARALLDGKDAAADVLRIASGDYGEKKEYLWRALGGNLKQEERAAHLASVKEEWKKLNKGSLEDFVSHLDPATREQASALLEQRAVPDGKRLAYGLSGWSKDGYDVAGVINRLGPDKAREVFDAELPPEARGKKAFDAMADLSLSGRERFAVQQALKGVPQSVADKVARAEDRVAFEHTGFALFTNAPEIMDGKLAELKRHAADYETAKKRGDQAAQDAAERQVDLAFEAVKGNAEVNRLEQKGTGEYSAAAIQMTAALASAPLSGGASIAVAVAGGVLSTSVNAAAQGQGYEGNFGADLVVNSLKSYGRLGMPESKTAGAVASGLVEQIGGGAGVRKVMQWGVEAGTQGAIFSGTTSTAQALGEGKSIDQALGQGFKSAQDAFLPGAGIGIAFGGAGEAFKAMFPKKGVEAPRPLELDTPAGSKLAQSAEEFVAPKFYQGSAKYQGLSQQARGDFDRLMTDLAARGKLAEGKSLLHLLEEGGLNLQSKNGQSMLESLTSLRDRPRLPEFQGKQAELFDQVLQSVTNPAKIHQGYNPTCTATSQQIGHAVSDPADYVRFLDEMTRTGEVNLPNGQKMRLNESTLQGFANGDNRSLVDAIYQDSAMKFGLESGTKGRPVDYVSNRPNFKASDGKLYPLTPEVAEQIKAKGGIVGQNTVELNGQTFDVVYESGAILPGTRPKMVEGVEMISSAGGLLPEERLAVTEGIFGRRVHTVGMKDLPGYVDGLPEGFHERMAARDFSKLTPDDRQIMKWLMTAADDAEASGRSVSLGMKWGEGGHVVQLVGRTDDGRFLIRNPQMSGPDIDFAELGKGLPRDGTLEAIGAAYADEAVSAVDQWTFYSNFKTAQATRAKPGR